jgi:hypothetical protein
MYLNKHLEEADSELHRIYRIGSGTRPEHNAKSVTDAVKAMLEYLKEVDQRNK